MSPLGATRAGIFRNPSGVAVVDDFNRPDGGLGVTSQGAVPWEVLAGSWTVAGNHASSPSVQSSNPRAVVQTGAADGTLQANVGLGGDALLFRVVDASNWWRVRTRYWQEAFTQFCYSYWYIADCYNASNPSQQCPGMQSCGSCGSCQGGCFAPNGCFQQPYTCSQYACGTTYVPHYAVVLDRMVAGTITTVQEVEPASASQLKVVMRGSNIDVYRQTVNPVISVTSSVHQTATKHGIGAAASDVPAGGAIDNFSFVPS